MAIGRTQRFYGQGRVDVPHLRAIESGVAYDVDVLMGAMLAGNKPLILGGFETSTVGVPGLLATALQINVAAGLVAHPLASDAGTILQVPADRAPEVLSTNNARVVGSFTANAVNFVGIDLFRTADASTSDIIQFLDENTNQENAQQLPLAATYDYVIYISTQDFSTTQNIAPLLKVVTDANNRVTSVEDSRNLMFRLGSGGSLTNTQHAYPFPAGRSEAGNNSDFHAGDKGIASLKDWMDATMTRLWELGGGERWYSPTADRNVMLVRNGTTLFTNGDYFEWSGTNLHWRELRFVFSNSTGWFNDIADQLTDSAGLTDLADGECVYVDVDRTLNRTGGTALAALKGVTATVGSSLIPGARFVLAWRIGTNIYTRGSGYAVGTTFNPATPTSLGMVKLSVTSGTPLAPVVFNPDANGSLTVAATASNANGVIASGNGSGAGVQGTGGATGAGVQGIGGTNGIGVLAQGTGTGAGLDVSGGATGAAAVIHGGAFTNPSDNVKFIDAASNLRWGLDRAGFPTAGRRFEWRENWDFTIGANQTSAAFTNTTRWRATVSGTAASYSAPAAGAFPCPLVQINPGTVTNAYSFIFSNASTGYINSRVSTYTSMVMEWDATLTTAGANGVTYFMGALTGAGGDPFNTPLEMGLYFTKANSDTNWQAAADNGVTQTKVSTGFATTPGNYNCFRIYYFGANTLSGAATALYYIDNVLVATITTNLPGLPWGFNFWAGGGCTANAPSQTLRLGPILVVYNRYDI